MLGIGVQNTGQGHATIYPRLVAAKLGIPAAQITHRHGDTDLDLKGNPSVGSRSTMTVGSALYRAVDLMLEKAKPIAAGLLEAADADVAYRDGNFEVVGTDRRVSLFEVAARAKASGDRSRHQGDGRHAADISQRLPHRRGRDRSGYRRGRRSSAYAAVDDAGVVLDHTLVEGQLVGGLAQGIGQALMENAVYDAGNGQLVTGTFMDYAMPRAADMPPIADAESQRAGDDQSARREGCRRGRHDRLDRRDHERDRERDPRRARRQHRHAGDAGQSLARLPRRRYEAQAALRSGRGTRGAQGVSSATSIGATSTRLRPRALAR